MRTVCPHLRLFLPCPLLLPKQAVQLAQLSLYFDVDRPLMTPPENVPNWIHMTMQQWDDALLPANHAGQEGLGGAQSRQPHDFLIQPVSGMMRYTRRYIRGF